MEKKASPPETSSPKKRKLGREEQAPLWKRFRGDCSLRCTGNSVMTQWAYQEEIVPEETVPLEKCTRILAENEDFMVIVPPPGAAARIRVLQREFVLDRADLLKGHPMHLAMAPREWADFCGVSADEAEAHEEIYSLLQNGSDTSSLICCVEKKTRCIRGYLHLSFEKGQPLELAYLKVQRRYQRRGLAKLMVDGGICLAREHRQWVFRGMALTVHGRNEKAAACYRKLGFRQIGHPKRVKSAFRDWSTMTKKL